MKIRMYKYLLNASINIIFRPKYVAHLIPFAPYPSHHYGTKVGEYRRVCWSCPTEHVHRQVTKATQPNQLDYADDSHSAPHHISSCFFAPLRIHPTKPLQYVSSFVANSLSSFLPSFVPFVLCRGRLWVSGVYISRISMTNLVSKYQADP